MAFSNYHFQYGRLFSGYSLYILYYVNNDVYIHHTLCIHTNFLKNVGILFSETNYSPPLTEKNIIQHYNTLKKQYVKN